MIIHDDKGNIFNATMVIATESDAEELRLLCEALHERLLLIRHRYTEASSDIAALFEHLPQDQEDGIYPVDGQSLTELQKAIMKN